MAFIVKITKIKSIHNNLEDEYDAICNELPNKGNTFLFKKLPTYGFIHTTPVLSVFHDKKDNKLAFTTANSIYEMDIIQEVDDDMWLY